jgi:hypothetical protein
VAYNIQIEHDKIKVLMEYESLTQKVLFGNAVFAALKKLSLSYTFIFRKQF